MKTTLDLTAAVCRYLDRLAWLERLRKEKRETRRRKRESEAAA